MQSLLDLREGVTGYRQQPFADYDGQFVADYLKSMGRAIERKQTVDMLCVLASGKRLECPEPGCGSSYKHRGWLNRHLRLSHPL
mgnify:CR=1 FL=1